MRPPQFDVSFENLPSDPKERHEVLVDLFGGYLFWTRAQTLMKTQQLIDVESERNKLGMLFREVFDDAARLSDEDRIVAMALAESAVSDFARMLLTMLSGQGFDDTFGPKHVFRFRIDMEICDADTGQVIYEEVINRGGRKFFPEYWGHWLNKYRKYFRD